MGISDGDSAGAEKGLGLEREGIGLGLNGEWRMENGKWRMENGKWRMERQHILKSVNICPLFASSKLPTL
jgi:hypothetical protein